MAEASFDPEATDIGPGVVLGGRFRVEAELGQGGMARVFRAIDLRRGVPVAIKVLRTDVADDLQALARMEREAEILGRLSHAAIVSAEAVGALGGGRMFLAMELLEGETLGERLRRGPMSPTELVPIVAAACAGLAAAHEAGIVHRDLKPDNLFLWRGGEGTPEVKLLDFGVSKLLGADGLTRTGQILGTPRYMAPEQLTADRDLDARVDVYAMGVILYEALSGHLPFAALTPTDLVVAILHGKVTPLRSYRPGLAPGVEEVVARAMARSPEARYGGALQLANAYLAVCAPEVVAPATPASGIRTSALGAMDPEGLAVAGSASSDQTLLGAPSVPPLRPGTFSALGARPAFRVPQSGGESDPETSASTETHTDAVQSPPPVGTNPSGARILLFVLPLIAGAISAGMALVALRAMDSAGPQEVAAAPSAAPVNPAPASAPLPLSETQPAPPAVEEPEGAEAAPQTTTDTVAPSEEEAGAREPDRSLRQARAAERRRARRQARARERSVATAPAVAVVAVEPPGPDASATELMRAARSARRVGDAEGCVDLLDRAIHAGAPVVALRLRGDCELRAGRRDAALRSYERFCVLALDHPAIGEVRAIVDGLGGRCQ